MRFGSKLILTTLAGAALSGPQVADSATLYADVHGGDVVGTYETEGEFVKLALREFAGESLVRKELGTRGDGLVYLFMHGDTEEDRRNTLAFVKKPGDFDLVQDGTTHIYGTLDEALASNEARAEKRKYGDRVFVLEADLRKNRLVALYDSKEVKVVDVKGPKTRGLNSDWQIDTER